MSSEQNIYIGSYIELTLLPIETYDVVRECPTCGIGHVDKNDNFCSICGERIEEKTYENIKYPFFSDIIGSDFDDSLISVEINEIPENKLIIISNMSNDEIHLDFDNTSEGVYEMPSGDIREIFNIIFETDIKIIKKHPLVEDVKLKQGAIIYWY